MSVDLHVSRELLDHIGRSEFARYLRLFDATVVGQKPGNSLFELIFMLDAPGAPEGAVQVVPTFKNEGVKGNVSVSLLGLEWLDARGQRIPEVADA